MPNSNTVFDERIKEIIKRINPKSVFDVGVGEGKYGKMVRSVITSNCNITGCEVHSKYFVDYMETYIENYSKVIQEDFRGLIRTLEQDYDLWIFGDVLEHFFHSEIYDCLDYCLSRSKYILIVTPVGCKQGISENNINERHVAEVRLHEISQLYDVLEFAKVPIVEYGFYMSMYLIRGEGGGFI